MKDIMIFVLVVVVNTSSNDSALCIFVHGLGQDWRDADEGIMFAEGECMDNYYATRLSDWMNKKPGKFMVSEVDLGDLRLETVPLKGELNLKGVFRHIWTN